MKHYFSVFAENAFTDSSGKLSIIQIFETISSKSFPVLHPQVVVVSTFFSEEGEPGKKVDFLAEMFDIHNNSSYRVEIKEATLGKKDNFIAMFRNLVFSSPGIYRVKISINGVEKFELPLELLPEV